MEKIWGNNIIDLDEKVDEFIRLFCYKTNFETKEEYEYLAFRIARVIEKVAIWFENNSTEAFTNFLETLPSEEKELFASPTWPSVIWISYGFEYLRLNKQGIIIDDGWTSKRVLSGIHISSIEPIVKKYYKENYGINYHMKNSITDIFKQYNDEAFFLNSLFDAILYRIIARGGVADGPIRGLMFAKKFNRDISEPIKYGIDINNYNLDILVDNYLRFGGSLDVVCYGNYFSSKENAFVNQIFLKEAFQYYQSLLSKSVNQGNSDAYLLRVALCSYIIHHEVDKDRRK